MKKNTHSEALSSALLASALLLASSAASATTWSFNDPCNVENPDCNTPSDYAGSPLYYGGYGTAVEGSDTVGSADTYDILNLTASIDSNNLTVSVLTRFVEDGVSKVRYGDLMLSTSGYNPNGSPPYTLDSTSTTGTTWNYVVSTSSAIPYDPINNPTGWGDGIGTLYKNPTSLKLSNDVPQDANLYKTDQYVLFGSGGIPYSNAGVSIGYSPIYNGVDYDTGTLLTYTIPLSDIELVGGAPLENTGVAIRWAMTCANDIAEAYVIPEPETLALFLSGLLSLVLLTRLTKPAKPS